MNVNGWERAERVVNPADPTSVVTWTHAAKRLQLIGSYVGVEARRDGAVDSHDDALAVELFAALESFHDAALAADAADDPFCGRDPFHGGA